MKYGKVVNGQIVNWITIQPGDSLKIRKATDRDYRPEEDTPPAITEYQRLEASGWDIHAFKLVKLYNVVDKSQAEKDAIDAEKEKAEAIATNLPNWATIEAGIVNAFPDLKQRTILLKWARASYVYIRNSLT